MKIGNIVPVTGDVITPAMIEYTKKYLGAETVLVTKQIAVGPSSIECEYDEAMAAPAVIAMCKEMEQEGCDAIFVNCFGDPGVRGARECVNVPVFGGFEPAMYLALGLADTIGIITVLDNVLALIEGSVARAKLSGRVCCVKGIGIPVEELQQQEKLCAALTLESEKAIKENGAQAIVLGCTAMVDVAEEVKRRLLAKGLDIPVIEAAQTAVMFLELSARMGMKQSRITYMTPPKRD